MIRDKYAASRRILFDLHSIDQRLGGESWLLGATRRLPFDLIFAQRRVVTFDIT